MTNELERQGQDKSNRVISDQRYKFVRKIARGGFAQVYKAEDLALER